MLNLKFMLLELQVTTWHSTLRIISYTYIEGIKSIITKMYSQTSHCSLRAIWVQHQWFHSPSLHYESKWKMKILVIGRKLLFQGLYTLKYTKPMLRYCINFVLCYTIKFPCTCTVLLLCNASRSCLAWALNTKEKS